MASRNVQSQLVQLCKPLGLEESDVAQQIWPQLQSLKNADAVKRYITDLVGHSAATETFLRDYAAMRSAATPSTSRPPSQTAQLRSGFAKESDLDFIPRLPESYKTPLRELDRQIESLTLSTASKEDAPSKRQLKKGRAHACFCHARQHVLSPFTPLCPRCALPLCTLHPPLTPCPSCTYHPILTTASRQSHLSRLQADRTHLLDRAREDLRREPERFPDLAAPSRPSTSTMMTTTKTKEEPRVVLSIGGKGKGTTRTTYTTRPAVSPTPAAGEEGEDEEMDSRMQPFVDEYDEGVIRLKGEAKVIERVEGRKFANPAMKEVYASAGTADRLDAL